MKKLLFILCLISQIGAESKDLPDANDFLDLFKENLEESHRIIIQRSLQKNYLRFRGYELVDYKIYKQMSPNERKNIKKPLIFFRGILQSKPTYSELGGVSVHAILAQDTKDKKAQKIYLNFDGRYLSDLLTIGESREFYALCAVPLVNRCLLIGIGEKW
ncbi:hypothetical protein [Helicobacter fennelliae]|uniref:Uncharacterized protein n=1 Tax=Helicobacter fennelliae MRY12-0050 TaxID=1325130 RepID=T1DWZ3_9HELI|nr:hypothetical protein [Helicobacter fennelliae]GAD19832.1 hypothetical protein HFN_1072 [Helicobacter fennelliae MRY12-0050]STP07977.1 Uncharacterised protein [Helicobacter fennelliae]STQ84114.1 Uncharacterised protein [Helicobacter fennelliae]